MSLIDWGLMQACQASIGLGGNLILQMCVCVCVSLCVRLCILTHSYIRVCVCVSVCLVYVLFLDNGQMQFAEYI